MREVLLLLYFVDEELLEKLITCPRSLNWQKKDSNSDSQMPVLDTNHFTSKLLDILTTISFTTNPYSGGSGRIAL